MSLETVTAEASEESIAAAAVARKAVDAIYAVVEENKEYLGRIDADSRRRRSWNRHVARLEGRRGGSE